MTRVKEDWLQNQLDEVRRRERRFRDIASVLLVLTALLGGYAGFLLSQNMIPLSVGVGLSFALFVFVQLAMRRVESRNPWYINISEEGLLMRSPGRGEWSLPYDRIHSILKRLPEVDVVYYFNEDGWLRGFSVDKGLGLRIEEEFIRAQEVRGPFSKPSVAFRPIVTIPWLIIGFVTLGVGLPSLLSSLEPYNRTLYIWGMLGIVGGLAMLVYGVLTFVWWLRERGRRAQGEATAMLIAGLE